MRAFRPGQLPTLVVLVLLALLLALGGWQLQRADEKSALLASQEARRQAPAQPIGELERSADPAFQRVLLRGYFDAEHSLLLDNRTRDGRVGVEQDALGGGELEGLGGRALGESGERQEGREQ